MESPLKFQHKIVSLTTCKGTHGSDLFIKFHNNKLGSNKLGVIDKQTDKY